MNRKIIYSMLVVLGALLIFWVVLRNVDSPTSVPKSLSALDIEFDAEKAVKIDVYKRDYPDSGLHFAKIDTEWVVANAYNAPAKRTDIEKLLTDLNQVSGQIRGETAELYEDFDITDERALQIEIFDGEASKLLHIYIGKGGSGRDCFMRLSESPTVYLANENFISRFAAWNAPPEKKLPTDRWIELSLCNVPRESIKSFKIKKGKTEYEFALMEEPSEDTLAPPAEVWTQISPEKGLRLEESKVKRLHSNLASIRASGVTDPENKDKFGLDKPDYTIRVADAEGNSSYIKFGKPVNEEEDRYVVVDGKNAVYVIPKNTFDRIFEDQFKKPDK
ncbi:MAG: DUF4340 domain-containing protein [Candidatus Zixiibacteriota bacterium]|nr:MAG: DUF4340 domain-containing protein [candidate division Zixibacteria bacterium]